ncbi:hypothetical protein AB0P21_09770 [Kribbella sp. NPDC056861]|uniref:hypothetical protein n=1 Tax=Kribbella sp. NPDC056861 TaxID=3154857 RepID=UPI00342743D0
MRRLVALITHLPPDSALSRTVNSGWSDDRELAAALVELAHAQFRATLAAGGVKRLPRPLKVPRPDPYQPDQGTAAAPARPKSRQPTEAEVLAFFAGR